MTSDMTGEVRCPSCGRPTPLAPFCTHCGAVVPEGASAPRAHAMDRRELEERARQMHGQSSPFRRGTVGDESSPADAWSVPAAPGEFIPEPSDELARRPDSPSSEESPRIDNFDERPVTRPAPPAPVAPPAPAGTFIPAEAAPPGTQPSSLRPITPPSLAVPPVVPSAPPASEPVQPSPAPLGYQPPNVGEDRPGDSQARGYSGGNEAGGDDEGGYGHDGYDRGDGGYGGPGWPADDGPPRRSSALPILGFLVLGIAALLGGAVLFSALNASPGVAAQSTTPSTAASATAAASETPAESPGDSGSASASTEPSAGATPDTFTARAQACASNDMGFSGCTKDGTTLSGTQVWVWVGFKNAQAANVLGVTIVDKAGGSEVGDGSLELDKLTGCDPGKTCSGYIQMTFGDLSPGSYTIQVTRDGTQVAATDFTVTA